jgi:hypothetical protein
MSCVFQNIDPPPPSPPCECAFVAGGGHTRRLERGVGGQYFGRRKTQLCTVDTIMGPAYYSILKYQRSLIWREGGNPALRARHFGLALLGERVFL